MTGGARLRTPITGNHLFYGDNLAILRKHVPDESVDLIYLDPPFNSNASYNVLFRSPAGEQSKAQIEAFEDTWHWNQTAEEAFDQVMSSGVADAAEMLRAMRGFLKENDLMAYLTMMAVRLIELHRILKPTGSFYLHCDPTASHYLKMLLDGVFGAECYRNEITWKRTAAHADARTWSRVADTLFFYTKGRNFTWHVPREVHTDKYVGSHYGSMDDKGRKFQLTSILSPSPRPNMMYEWKGFASPPMGWRFSESTMASLDEQGLIYYPSRTDGSLDTSKRPRFKRYLDEQLGNVTTTIWTDIPPVNARAQERLGYPTQKPLALLERILRASTNEGDVVLDPFCGCGTTIHAAQKLGRRWVGIDITHIAVSLIEKRLRAFDDIRYTVHGVPQDAGGAAALADADKHQFQLWAVSRIDGAQPFKGGKKGADGGIDGFVYFKPDGKATERAIVSVKGGGNVGVGMVKDLIATVDREKAKVGVFVTLTKPTRPMLTEAVTAGFYEPPHHAKVSKIQILTVDDLFAGRQPQLPFVDTSVFKRAAKEQAEQPELF